MKRDIVVTYVQVRALFYVINSKFRRSFMKKANARLRHEKCVWSRYDESGHRDWKFPTKDAFILAPIMGHLSAKWFVNPASKNTNIQSQRARRKHTIVETLSVESKSMQGRGTPHGGVRQRGEWPCRGQVTERKEIFFLSPHAVTCRDTVRFSHTVSFHSAALRDTQYWPLQLKPPFSDPKDVLLLLSACIARRWLPEVRIIGTYHGVHIL